MSRQKIMIIVDTKRDAIHFCETKLQGDDIWFDLNELPLSHRGVENIMTLNNVAANVVGLKLIRKCGVCEDWQVIYNETPGEFD